MTEQVIKMKYSKPAISIEKQIDKLRQRGLIIANKNYAQQTLSSISYYRLRAYTYPFQNNEIESQPFGKEITFEKIIALYEFDSKLRLLLFEATEKVEVALRTQIIYNFSLSHGSHWQLNPKLYRNNKRFIEHTDSLNKEINRSKEVFISHYRKKYTNPTAPPSWMSLEVISMGLLSKIFQNLKKGQEKQAIQTYFRLSKIDILENWMFCFTQLRNICAHHGRIWNRRLPKILIPRNTPERFISNIQIHQNKLYATLCCLQYALNTIDKTNSFKKDIQNLLKKYPQINIKDMGFSENWEKEYFWNIK